MASKVKRLMVKPKTWIRKMPPISETGIATTGTSAERSEPRNRKITITTISSVSSSVCTTSSMALRMYLVAS